ncbi:MAG: hypothetical protein HETSPECPRED_004273 [Heterodermia speciosa]|uniref:Uncharacterized protein n=1 Tax=Heterodermia speciosa TaxID=116794 RepID=A0A8H3FGM5_9LECA|nr:MAG: hypothetical protein HETSPECPRED_004273 [Heterodermia speciosa]
MAKAKLKSDTQPVKPIKETISTSKIFKNAQKQNLQSKKSRTKQKRKVTPSHPLACAFDDNIEKSHDVIEKVSIEATESATQALLQRFHHNRQKSAEQLDADAKIDEILYLAPSEEGIEYARRDGSQSSKTTLGVQMRRFEKIVAKEEQELESLWKQWASVQEELAKMAEDALGPDWATTLPVLSANDRQMIDDGNDEAFGTTIERLKDLIKTTSEQAVEKMVASEKDFKIKQDDQNRKLLRLFREDDEAEED